MGELGRIIGLNLDQAAALQLEAVAGNKSALRTFILWSSWRKIEGNKRSSHRAKLSAMRFLIENLNIELLPSDAPQIADKAISNVPEQQKRPWWGN